MTEANRRGDRLLATAKAQQAANRASLLRSEQEQRDLGAIGRLSGLRRPAAAGTTVSSNIASGDPPRRRPEPPTPTLRKSSPHNAAFIDICTFDGTYPLLTDSYTKFYIRSGDDTKHLEITIPNRVASLTLPSPFLRESNLVNDWYTIVWDKTTLANQAENSQVFDYKLFPIDKESAIIAIGYAACGSSADYADNESEENGVNSEVYSFEYLTETFEGPRSETIYARRFVSYAPTSIRYSFKNKVYCIYVSNTNIRTVSTPAAIANLFDWRNTEPLTRDFVSTTGFVTYAQARLDKENPALINLFYDQYYDYTQTGLASINLVRSYEPNPLYEEYFARARFTDLRAGNVGFERQVDIRFVGPGIYTYTSNQQQADEYLASYPEDTWIDPFKYAYIGSSYIPDKSYDISTLDPTFSTLLKYNGPPLTATSPYDYPPVGDNQDVENPVWKKYAVNKSMPQLPPDNHYYSVLSDDQLSTGDYDISTTAFFYWDWAAPSYCRQQLIALGFTEADISP